MTDGEIRGFYRDSKNKKKAINILMDMTGYSRNEILEILELGGYDISMHIKEKEVKETERTIHKRNFDEDKARELYDKGAYDEVIAKDCHVTRVTIITWRKENNLVSNYFSEKEREKEQILELYNQGLNDREISERLGISLDKAFQFRKKNNLKPNGKRKSRTAATVTA